MYKQAENSDLYIHLYMHNSAFAVHLTLKQLNVPLNVPHRGTIAGQMTLEDENVPLFVPLSGTIAGQTAPKGENVPLFVPLSGTFAAQKQDNSSPSTKFSRTILDNYIGRRYTRATIYRKPI